jgi:hypothetical protein
MPGEGGPGSVPVGHGVMLGTQRVTAHLACRSHVCKLLPSPLPPRACVLHKPHSARRRRLRAHRGLRGPTRGRALARTRAMPAPGALEERATPAPNHVLCWSRTRVQDVWRVASTIGKCTHPLPLPLCHTHPTGPSRPTARRPRPTRATRLSSTRGPARPRHTSWLTGTA